MFSPQQEQDVLLEINTPPESYHLLNTDASMEFSMGEKSKLKIGLTINNILNNKNP